MIFGRATAGNSEIVGFSSIFEAEQAGFCDALADPSPTGRVAAGRLSREITGEVISLSTNPVLTGRSSHLV